MTFPTGFPPAALAQLDNLDDALAEYLDALELYQLAQQKLAEELKQVRRSRRPSQVGLARCPSNPAPRLTSRAAH